VIVVDASAVVEALFNAPRAASVLEHVARSDETLHAPELVDLEVTNTLRRYVSAGQLDAAAADGHFRNFLGLRLQRHPHAMLLPRVWELRRNLTAYDAAYVALAEELGCALLTADARLARSAGHEATIRLLS
jgi:predicted nucleic acid-binding protein